MVDSELGGKEVEVVEQGWERQVIVYADMLRHDEQMGFIPLNQEWVVEGN